MSKTRCAVTSFLCCLKQLERYMKFKTSVYVDSLVKMVYGFAVDAEASDPIIRDVELAQSIRRNFSGLDDLDPVKIFSRHFSGLKRSVKVTKYNKL